MVSLVTFSSIKILELIYHYFFKSLNQPTNIFIQSKNLYFMIKSNVFNLYKNFIFNMYCLAVFGLELTSITNLKIVSSKLFN